MPRYTRNASATALDWFVRGAAIGAIFGVLVGLLFGG